MKPHLNSLDVAFYFDLLQIAYIHKYQSPKHVGFLPTRSMNYSPFLDPPPHLYPRRYARPSSSAVYSGSFSYIFNIVCLSDNCLFVDFNQFWFRCPPSLDRSAYINCGGACGIYSTQLAKVLHWGKIITWPTFGNKRWIISWSRQLKREIKHWSSSYTLDIENNTKRIKNEWVLCGVKSHASTKGRSKNSFCLKNKQTQMRTTFLVEVTIHSAHGGFMKLIISK